MKRYGILGSGVVGQALASGAKAEVARVLELFGWEAVDMGSVTAARTLESLAQLWCIPGLLRNQWTHAFKLLQA